MDESVVPAEIVDHYEHDYDESARITTGFGTLELVRTQEIVEPRAAAGPGCACSTWAAAPGVHARWLAEAGHEVEVVDPMPRHVEAVGRARRPTASRSLRGSATRAALPHDDGTFDAVLLLGPLYHLIDRDDRVQAWREARARREAGRARDRGRRSTASRRCSTGLARRPPRRPEFRTIVERRPPQRRSTAIPSGNPRWFTTAYFHHPDELEAEAADAGVDGRRDRRRRGPRRLAAATRRAQWDDAAGRGRRSSTRPARVESEPTLRGLERAPAGRRPPAVA